MLLNYEVNKSKITSNPDEVILRLLELDPTLNEDIFIQANMRGFAARLEATPAHAPTAAGTFHWHGFVPALRNSLIIKNWRKKDHKNCPLIISPDKNMMILVMTGNSDTGKESGHPSNQGAKGSVVDEGVQMNQQYELFENAAISRLKRGSSGTQLWVLLYHVEQTKEGYREIRTELSLPSKFKNKKIIDWAERIIFKPISLDQDFEIEKPTPMAPIDIPIERRA